MRMMCEGGLVLELEWFWDEESKWIINGVCWVIYGLLNLKEDLIEWLLYWIEFDEGLKFDMLVLEIIYGGKFCY